ncbi:MAG: ABC transporter substrate-binding protein [Limnospira sp. PMC 1291.21]|uniref:Thiamine pyrimidine synthase n=2 Tax=Limnospira TaxID=2596745 RepID=B5W208_LIMMA|nr:MULTISPECIES: ABC transporter substrate-binding protein [Limnospira]AMW26781.1 hypothetical protein AP285_00995 [Arthrospira platensis YZ]EKD09528.1 hypothetical protein SPLC1_S180010 [Arthrospira platensis C1]MDC0838955.1 ABC transporter substrate-binding protein [Limnoraphis robusta]EDZ94437.1 NMT1/THI5 like domain protein [Limnospira maxima CS-328]MDT9179579.1 ABC transporter substrate-binding protein [Limnospira sp. PMC 1238.20]
MIINRRQFLKTSAFLGGSLLLDKLRGPAAVAANELATHPDQIIMQLDWKYNAQFAGVLLADYYNLYKSSGLAVEIRPGETAMIVTNQVAKNPAIIGCGEQDIIMNAQIAGQPIKAIATMFQNSPLGLMSMPNSQIYDLQDLIGKRVGMEGESYSIMQMAMGYDNIPSHAIEIILVSGEEKHDLLLRGEVDAVQCYIVDEPIGFAAKTGITPNIIKFSDYGYDAYVQVIFAHNELLQYHPEIVQKFLEVTFAGWRLALDDVEKAAKIIVNNYAEPGGEYDDLDYQIASLKQVANYVTGGLTDKNLGKINSDRWQSMAAKFEKYGIINDVPLFSNSVDDRFIN